MSLFQEVIWLICSGPVAPPILPDKSPIWKHLPLSPWWLSQWSFSLSLWDEHQWHFTSYWTSILEYQTNQEMLKMYVLWYLLPPKSHLKKILKSQKHGIKQIFSYSFQVVLRHTLRIPILQLLLCSIFFSDSFCHSLLRVDSENE